VRAVHEVVVPNKDEGKDEFVGLVDLLVAPVRANRKQPHSHPSWLERYDAAVLQGLHELGQVREQRSRQCVRLPAALAAKLDDRRPWRGTRREQRAEISIRGHDDSTLDGSALEDRIVIGVLQSYERTWIAS
jgi:hypothetical protein